MRILCMLPAGRGVYPPEAEQRRLDLMRSYATAATQIDAEYMPGISGFSPWGGAVGRRRRRGGLPARCEPVQRAGGRYRARRD